MNPFDQKKIKARVSLLLVLLLILCGVNQLSAGKKNIKKWQTPTFKAIIKLEIKSPFVPDGRINFQHFEFKVFFPEIRIVFDPSNPNEIVNNYLDIIKPEGRGEIVHIKLNPVQFNTQKEQPRIKEPFTKSFQALLEVVSDFDSTAKYFEHSNEIKEEELDLVYPMPAPPSKPPAKIYLRFRPTSFNFHKVIFLCSEGSEELSNEEFQLEFELDWQELIHSDTIIKTIPWQGEPEDKGSWLIELRRIKKP